MSTSKLILHCGAHRVTLDQLEKSSTPSAERLDGKRPFIPIPHFELFSMVQEKVLRVGLKVVETEHALQPWGDIQDAMYFGLMRLEGARGRSTTIGIRNSNAKNMCAGLVVGDYVFVCDNLAFTGEIKIARRHTRNIWEDLDFSLDQAVAKVVQFEGYSDQRFEVYKNTQISEDFGIKLLTDMSMKEDILPWSTVKNAIQEWQDPSHPEHACHGQSVYLLMNAITEVLKPRDLRNPDRLNGAGRQAAAAIWSNPDSTIKMHKILDEVCNFTAMIA